MRPFLCGVILALATTLATPAAARTDLEAVKALYAAADYDGALRLLASADAADNAILIEEYRALCLLALGRTTEAERSVEAIFGREPMYTVDPAQVSPRMVALVNQVRLRLVPALARALYGAARRNFEQKQYGAAAQQLTEMLALIEATGSATAGLGDLRMLGEGYLELASKQLAAATTPAVPAGGLPDPLGAPGVLRTGVYSDFLRLADEQSAAARAPIEPPPADALVTGPEIYTAADRIQPPVPVQRDVPRWTPPDAISRLATHPGLVELVIDQEGRVESATIADSVHASYDPLLVEAARQWRYRPATRNGRPVRYRLQQEVVLRPSTP